jgi:hypothetical protein
MAKAKDNAVRTATKRDLVRKGIVDFLVFRREGRGPRAFSTHAESALFLSSDAFSTVNRIHFT